MCRLGLPLGEAVQCDSFKPCAAASHALQAWYGVQLALTHTSHLSHVLTTRPCCLSHLCLCSRLRPPHPAPHRRRGGHCHKRPVTGMDLLQSRPCQA